MIYFDIDIFMIYSVISVIICSLIPFHFLFSPRSKSGENPGCKELMKTVPKKLRRRKGPGKEPREGPNEDLMKSAETEPRGSTAKTGCNKIEQNLMIFPS